MYKVTLKDRTVLRVADEVGIDLEKALTDSNMINGFFKASTGTYAISQIKSVVKEATAGDDAWSKRQVSELDANLKEINAYNLNLLKKNPADRAEHEIQTRIVNGLNEMEKDNLTVIYEKLHSYITKYFEKNPEEPVCPFKYWGGVIKKYVVKKEQLPQFFKLITTNDAAVWRWKNKKGEWFDYCI